MRFIRILPLLFGAALQTVLLGAAQDRGFKVVANVANPLNSLTRAQVSRLFLKTETTWPSGQLAIPIDLGQKSDVRASFSRAIHGRDVPAITSYWQRMIFSGVSVPPTELASDEAVLAFVRTNSGAVGYVSADAALPAQVKVLQVID